MKPESQVEQEVAIAAMYFNCNLMRNNSGAFKDATGRFVFFGLGNISAKRNKIIKSVDRIGIAKVLITPEMVGRTVGVFVALEIKEEAWNENKKLDEHEIAQNNFLQLITSYGGIAGFVSKVDKLTDIFGRWYSNK
jgi:hypothetical protein